MERFCYYNQSPCKRCCSNHCKDASGVVDRKSKFKIDKLNEVKIYAKTN